MTRLCRFNDDRLGLVEGDRVLDITAATKIIPAYSWPLPQVDPLIAHLPAVLAESQSLKKNVKQLKLTDIRLKSPVANPPKIIAAPVNYLKHQQEALADGGRHFEKDVKTIADYGLFLKSSSSIVGFGEAVEIAFPERRTDHEIELVVVIGREAHRVSTADALDYVAGYMLGLDMTIRGSEDRSLRKSLDSFSVAGPWLVTPDEAPDPTELRLWLTVNDEPRQNAPTSDLIFSVRELIAYASRFFRLLPGDLIYTGTPEGVGPVQPGDTIRCGANGLGEASILVRTSNA